MFKKFSKLNKTRNYSTTKSIPIQFYLNGKLITEKEIDPRLSLIEYLRSKRLSMGTKLGCSVGVKIKI